MRWRAIRKTFHNGVFVHPGQEIEADEKFDGRPNMEPVKDEPEPKAEEKGAE
jgi:hypothetical protein